MERLDQGNGKIGDHPLSPAEREREVRRVFEETVARKRKAQLIGFLILLALGLLWLLFFWI